IFFFFFFSSRRRHTRWPRDWSSDVCSSDLVKGTYSFADPTTGKLQTSSRSFIITGVIQPTGNNQIDKAVVINEATANSLFHKTRSEERRVGKECRYM